MRVQTPLGLLLLLKHLMGYSLIGRADGCGKIGIFIFIKFQFNSGFSLNRPVVGLSPTTPVVSPSWDTNAK